MDCPGRVEVQHQIKRNCRIINVELSGMDSTGSPTFLLYFTIQLTTLNSSHA